MLIRYFQDLCYKTDFVLIHPLTNVKNILYIHATVALDRCTTDFM